jgi:hypothetical protein
MNRKTNNNTGGLFQFIKESQEGKHPPLKYGSGEMPPLVGGENFYKALEEALKSIPEVERKPKLFTYSRKSYRYLRKAGIPKDRIVLVKPL